MAFQTPRGTRDFLPQEMIKRQFVIDNARKVFEHWGFDPIDTPAFEDYELLTAKSGDAIKDEIYYFKDKSDRALGLRFDFTVPLGRIIASNPEIPKPFRRYHMGPVWRYDRPGSGRYREFWQADVDIVGASGVAADAEVVMCACDVLRKIGLHNFSVRLNNRKIINSILDSFGTKSAEIMRTMDKLEKIGEDDVRKELEGKNVDGKIIDLVLDFVRLKDIEDVAPMIHDEKGKHGLRELEELMQVLKKRSIPVRADMSMVRGLDYYTGNIFEIVNEGSDLTITAGGRYDSLIENLGGKSLPAVGISLGIDRLVNIVQLPLGKTKVNVYVANVNENTLEKAGEIAAELRSLGLNAECDVMLRSLSKQFDYANSKGIKYVVVVGEKEIKSGMLKLRNMESGNEKDIEFRNLRKIADIINSE